jgi:RNA binding exosome subunit
MAVWGNLETELKSVKHPRAKGHYGIPTEILEGTVRFTRMNELRENFINNMSWNLVDI